MRVQGYRRTTTAAYVCWCAVLGTLIWAVTGGSARAAEFGIEPGSFATSLSSGQAGAHPDLTTTFTIAQEPTNNPIGFAKDITLELPPGIVGNPGATPQCNMNDVEKERCPSDTAVGVAKLAIAQPPTFKFVAHPTLLVYNIKPYLDEPAAFAFNAANFPVRLDAHVRSNGDYGITVSVTGTTDARPLISSTITMWGVPADHNGPGAESTNECVFNEVTEETECVKYGARGGGARLPFLRNPTVCGGAMTSTLSIDSWQMPGAFKSASSAIPGMVGCDALTFEPSISVTPDNLQAGAPAGYGVTLHVPQDENPEGLATPDVAAATVTLPSGTVLSPAAADGLGSCSDEQFSVSSLAPASCPAASQIGTVRIRTPLLASQLEGQLFLAAPDCAPCTPSDAADGRMVRLFLQAQGSGVIVKLAGETSIDQSTGLLRTTFPANPQLPFEDVTLNINGGARAPLANPRICGAPLAAASRLTPYSSEIPAEPSSEPFQLSGCPPPEFKPSFSAGTTNNRAGAFSAETVTFARTDQDGSIDRVTVHTPPGLIGMLSSIKTCSELQAQAARCGSDSQIGTTTVGVGPGSSPFFLGGKVYLTGPYEGAPFGLSIVVPALAGPFNLGTVNVRARINVDPVSSALTITSDPLPQALDGIPLQIKTVNVNINREGFIFNPTACRPMAIDGALASTNAITTTVSSRYQAANCAELPFTPKFTVLTHAKTSKIDGAYLHVKVTSGPGQANIGNVRVDLPKQLPSRLTTLQKACVASVFEANPASCPAASVVGTGAALTPVLSSELTGPAYLVSHGGAAFPDLEIVLQGEGITLILDGTTDIRKGITISTFNSVPDAPITRFDLVLPQGPHSALAAYGSLCRSTLSMPTRLTGQNGAVIRQTTRIAVSGCPKAHPKRKLTVSRRTHM
jgi:hypothetical protein